MALLRLHLKKLNFYLSNLPVNFSLSGCNIHMYALKGYCQRNFLRLVQLVHILTLLRRSRC